MSEVVYLYVTDNFEVGRRLADGTGYETLVDDGLLSPRGIDIDPVGEMMYWVESQNGGRVSRANLDGTGVQILRDFDTTGDYERNTDIAIDVGEQRIYWVDQENFSEEIERADLDGSNPEQILGGGSETDVFQPLGIALDVTRGLVFWTDNQALESIYSASLDGSGAVALYDTTASAVSLDIDPDAGLVYFSLFTADDAARGVWTMDIDGSNPALLFGTEDGFVNHLDLDLDDQYVYLCTSNGLVRATFDGATVDTLDATACYGIAVHRESA